MKKLLILMMALAMVFTLCACSMPAVSNPDGSDTVAGAAIKTGLDVIETLVVTALGIAGAAWAAKAKDKAYLQNINIAVETAVNLARQTAGELKQTVVDGMKAASPDGKLSDEQIAALKQTLIELTLKKLDSPTKDLLAAAGADLCAIITGAGEDCVREMKEGFAFVQAPESEN